MSNYGKLAAAGALAVLVSVVDFVASRPAVDSVTVMPKAEAIIGRPLTPVSFAGVARRTYRRCYTGVYYCR